MIKFFRHIRKSLLEQNKTGKYLKYAIGEIILVMIGILLALQVNNWNNQRADRKLEKRYLSELILDLQTDSMTISEFKNISDEQVRVKNRLLSYYQGQSFSEDSLFISFIGQWQSPAYSFRPISTTLDEMKSTGTISVIQNVNIRRQILETYNYYTYHISNPEGIYGRQQIELVDLIFSKVPKLYNFTYDVENSVEELNIKNVLNQYEIKNRLLGNFANGFNEALDSLQTVNTKLISNIRLELKRIEK